MPEVLEKTQSSRYIKKSLENFAQENSMTPQECDFTLLKSKTYIKSSLSGEFELFAQESVKKYLNKEKILNEHVEFQQRHHFVLHKKKSSKLELNYKLLFDEHASHPKLLLSANSLIPYEDYTPKQLLNLLYQECNKIKAYHQILIRIFDTVMVSNLKVLVKYIYTKKFTKNVKIALFDGIEPIITRKSKLIYWFKEKENVENSQFVEVVRDELLIEYKKPIFGMNGLNAYGELISTSFVSNVDNLQAEIDEESIYIQEDENTKKYLSKKQGYVHFNEKHLSVKNKILLNKISRNADALAKEEKNNIEVTISQRDSSRDSIGEGVALKSQTIQVNGFVGAKSLLEANNLIIDGATHQDSMQYAKFATINRHKGKLRCHDANIKLLEGGEVHATSVQVESCLGGVIYAKDAVIGHVKNNLKVYASNSITIKLLSGEDNFLYIGYKNIPILKKKIDFIRNDVEDLKYSLEQATRHNHDKVEPLKKQIQTLRDKINAIVSSYKDAKITIEQPCRGLNTITFEIDDKHKISYKTEAKAYSPFYLELEQDTITLHPVEKSLKIKE